MNAQIKKRAQEIIKNDLVNIIIGATIFAVMSMAVSTLSDNFVTILIAELIYTVASITSACFYFRAYNRGNADIKDIYALMANQTYLSKIGTIMPAMLLAHILLRIASYIFLIIPGIGHFVWFVSPIIIRLLLKTVWYLFVANPVYPTEYYMKGVAKYMRAEFVPFLKFTISISILPILIEVLISMLLNNTIANIVCIPLDAYVDLAIAGYVANIIPDEWFSGTVQF